MFADTFGPNLVCFLAGIATAMFFLRTGMVRRGVALFAVLIVSADVALVARFVYHDTAGWYQLALWTMQISAGGSTAWLLAAQWRRRWSAAAKGRRENFRLAYGHYLRSEFDEARTRFVRMFRVDPWDAPVAIALANVHWRTGRTRRAVALLRKARRLDRGRELADLVAMLESRMAKDPSSRTVAVSASATPVPADAERAGSGVG